MGNDAINSLIFTDTAHLVEHYIVLGVVCFVIHQNLITAYKGYPLTPGVLKPKAVRHYSGVLTLLALNQRAF